MTGRTGSEVPNWQKPYLSNQCCHNIIAIRSRTEALTWTARTLVSYYLDEEEWSQEVNLEQEAVMEENMAAWESVLDDYDGLLNVDN
jgi:hypothetical protein